MKKLKNKMKLLYELVESEQTPDSYSAISDELDNLIELIKPKNKPLRITGAGEAFAVDIWVSEQELEHVAKNLYEGQDYEYTKGLWIEYPDGKEERLDHVIDY